MVESSNAKGIVARRADSGLALIPWRDDVGDGYCRRVQRRHRPRGRGVTSACWAFINEPNTSSYRMNTTDSSRHVHHVRMLCRHAQGRRTPPSSGRHEACVDGARRPIRIHPRSGLLLQPARASGHFRLPLPPQFAHPTNRPRHPGLRGSELVLLIAEPVYEAT